MSNVQPLPERSPVARHEVASHVRVHLAHARTNVLRASAAIGMSKSALARRVNGETAFDIDDLELLADFLDVSLVDLITGTLPPVNTKKAPTREGEGLMLPDLDSNQEPAG